MDFGVRTKLLVVQLQSHIQLFATPWTAAHQASLSFAVSWSLLKLMSIESVMPSNHLIPSCLLLLPSIFPSIGVFSYESVLHIRWPKYWSFSFSISPSSEYSGLIFLTALISLQSKGLSRVFFSATQFKASILWLSAFFTVQLSHSVHMTGWTCVAMVNGIVSLISLSVFSWLVYRNARDFCVLILYPATLL